MIADRSRLGFLINLCWLALAVSGCHGRPGNSATFSFPASHEVVDWTRSGDMRTFPAADLWKYIDGEAERYVKAGVETASTADYRFRNKFDAVVDIYRMKTSAGAEQILASEPVVNGEAVSLGDSARVYSQSVVFRTSVYLVRVTAYDDSAELKAALLNLARGVEQRLAK